MKNSLKVSLVLVLAIIFSFNIVLADGIKYQDKAQILSDYGILKGSNQGFQLENPLSRVEGSVMLVRLMGKENEITQKKYTHPFKDVPAWANDYVGFLYENGFTKGTSATTFGSNDGMTAAQYITFLLRVLGYDDSKGDFAWNTSADKAEEIGMITGADKIVLVNKKVIIRDDMVGLSYAALNTKQKDKGKTLLAKLVSDGVIAVEEDSKTIEEKIAAVKELSSDGFAFHVSPHYPGDNKTSGAVYVIRNLLEPEAQDFTTYEVIQYSKDSTKEKILFNYIENEEENKNKNRVFKPGMSSYLFINSQWVIFLLDEQFNLLGFHIADPIEFNMKPEFFYDIKLTLEEPIQFDRSNSVMDNVSIIRKVNGVVDENYSYSGIHAGLSNNPNELFIKFMFYENDQVEYEIIPKKPNIKIISQERESAPSQLPALDLSKF